MAEGQHASVGEPLLLVLEEPPHAFTPEVGLSPQQEQVWRLLAAWSQEHEQPRNLLRAVSSRCEPWSREPTGLRRLPYGVSWNDTAVAVFGFPGGALDSARLPAFVLAVSVDPLLADEQAPVAHVFTPDLGLHLMRLPMEGPPPATVPGVALPPPLEQWRLALMWQAPAHRDGQSAELPDTLDGHGVFFTCGSDELEELLVEMLGVAQAQGSRTASPDPGPASSGSAVWEEKPFPDQASPGRPPPPLPGAVTLPLGTAAPPSVAGDWGVAGTTDPSATALEWALSARDSPWRARLVANPPPHWAAVRILHLRAGRRTGHSGGRPVMLEEDGVCEFVAAVLDVRSLPAAGIMHSPLSRLRMLHERLLTVAPGTPAESSWGHLLGQPAVLDRFVDLQTGLPSGFALSCDTGLPEVGTGRDLPLLAVVAGTAPSYRSALLDRGEDVAAFLEQPPGPIASAPPVWIVPPQWEATEELQLSTETTVATLALAPAWSRMTLLDWEDHEFGRTPFLRDKRDHGVWDVSVPGLAAARLHRFDWQPSGRGRTLTTVCFGVTDPDPSGRPSGFTVTIEKPLSSAESMAEPADALLGWVGVRP